MITVHVNGSKKDSDSVFAKMVHEDIEVSDINEISDFFIQNNCKFKNFDVKEGNIDVISPEPFTNLEGQFVTFNGKSFYLVKEMIYGKKLKELNKTTKKFDTDTGFAVELSDGSWERVSKLKVINNNITEKPIEFKLLKSNQKTTDYFKEYKIIQELRKVSVNVTGHRPNKLGGYNMKNPKMLQLKDALLKEIERLIVEEGMERFISGGALGADTAFAYCVYILQKKYPHIKNIIAVPFKRQDVKWSDEQKHWYHKMLEFADEIYYIDELEEYTTNEHLLDKSDKRYKAIGDYSPAKMQKRNEFMVDRSSRTIAIFDGTKGGTFNCVKYALKQGQEVIQLNPDKNFEKTIIDRY